MYRILYFGCAETHLLFCFIWVVVVAVHLLFLCHTMNKLVSNETSFVSIHCVFIRVLVDKDTMIYAGMLSCFINGHEMFDT